MAPSHSKIARPSVEENLARCSAPGLSLAKRLALLEDPYRRVRRAAARSLGELCDPLLLSALAMHRFPEARRIAAAHPGTPQKIIALLQRAGATADLSSYTEERHELTHEEQETLFAGGVFARCLLARCPNLSEALRAPLASDPVVAVRASLALHQNGAISVESEAYQVRRAAARNHASSLGALRFLAKDRHPGVRSAVASNLACTPELFEAVLRKETRAEVFRAAAQNPSLSKEWLLSLAERCPKEIFQNPAFPLLQLEDPSLSSQLGPVALRFLAGLESLSGALVQRVMEESSLSYLLEVLAGNPATPPSILGKLLCHTSRNIRARASKNLSAPRDILLLLYKAGATADLELWKGSDGFMGSLSLSFAEQERLLELDGFAAVLLANYPNTTEEIRLRLAGLPSWVIHSALLQSAPLLSGEVLRRLSAADRNISAQVGARAELPLDEILSWREANAGFWSSVAQQPSLPAPVIEALVTNEDSVVREWLARRDDLSELQRKKLLLDREPRVRAQAVYHPQSPQHFLAGLWAAGADRTLQRCDPPKKEVSRAFLREVAGLGFFGELLEAQNSKTPHELLASYAARDEILLLCALARNASLPEDLMWSLSRRPYIGVQGALLENPSLVSGVIQALAQSNRFNLQVSAHPNTLPSLLQQLAASSEKPLAQRIAKNPAANPETLKILAAAYQDEEPLLCSIVEHPNVDRDVILCLAASASQRVRILAARHKLFSEEMRSLFVKAGSSKNLICYGSPDLGWAEAELRRARALGPFPRALAILHPNATTPFLDEELSARDLHSLAPLWEQLGEEVIKARCRARPELRAVIQRG